MAPSRLEQGDVYHHEQHGRIVFEKCRLDYTAPEIETEVGEGSPVVVGNRDVSSSTMIFHTEDGKRLREDVGEFVENVRKELV